MDREVVERHVYQQPRKIDGVRAAHAGTVPDEIVSRCVGRVEIEIKRANFDAAHSAIDMAQASLSRPTRWTRATPLTETDLEMRILNALDGMGITKIGQVLNCTRSYLLTIPGMGDIRVDDLIRKATVWGREIVDGENGE